MCEEITEKAKVIKGNEDSCKTEDRINLHYYGTSPKKRKIRYQKGLDDVMKFIESKRKTEKEYSTSHSTYR